MLLTVLLELVIFAVISARCVFDDGAVWHYYAGHCYFASGAEDKRNNKDANLSCWHLDSYLLSVTSCEEEQFVVNNLIGCRDCDGGEKLYYQIFWIGLRKAFPIIGDMPDINETRAGWSWQSGETYNRQNWFDGDSNLEPEPDEFSGYAGMYSDGFWTGLSRSSKYRYICEREDIGNKTTRFPVSTTSIDNAEREGHNTSLGQMFTTSSPLTRGRRLPTTSQPSQERLVSTLISRSHGGKGATSGGDNNKYIYIGLVLGVVVVMAVVAFVILWRRRASKSQRAPEMPQVTRQGHYDDTVNVGTTREENEYVDLGGFTQTPGSNFSDLHSLPQNSSPSDSNDMYAEVGRAERMLPSSDGPAGDGDPSVLYAVPHRGGHDDDDDEVTIVDNTAYSNY